MARDRTREAIGRTAAAPPKSSSHAGRGLVQVDLEFRPTAADVRCSMFERKPPIRSTQEDVVELAEEIDHFVIGLAEKIDAIQDAELVGKTAEVAQLARLLSQDADRLGYPGMAMSAKGVANAAEDDRPDDLQETIVELTELAQRIRQGHRGAA